MQAKELREMSADDLNQKRAALREDLHTSTAPGG